MDAFCLLLLGSPAIQENRVATAQCLSGTGSLRVGAEFLAKHYHQVNLTGFLIFALVSCYHFEEQVIFILPIFCFPAYYIHSTAIMGKPCESFHDGRVVGEELPLL